MQVIYGILNKVTGKQYVGSTKDFYIRKRIHLSDLNRNLHHSIKLQRSWNKYGQENFIFLILEKVEDIKDLLSREQWWIDNSNSFFNCCKKAYSCEGLKRSQEVKNKLSKIKTNNPVRYWKNKQFSKEHKEKLSAAKKGKSSKLKGVKNLTVAPRFRKHYRVTFLDKSEIYFCTISELSITLSISKKAIYKFLKGKTRNKLPHILNIECETS